MDPLAGVRHRLTRGPAGEETEMRRSGRVPAHPAVMEAEKVQPLTAFTQLHDPRLGVLEHESELGEDLPQRHKRALGLSPGPAHHDHIVRETHQLACTYP